MSGKHGCQKFPVWRMCCWKNVQSGPKTHVWGSMWAHGETTQVSPWESAQTLVTLVCSPGKHLFLQNLFFLCEPLILFNSKELLSALLLTGHSLLYLCTGRMNFLVSAISQIYTREERGIIDTLPGVVYDHVISPDFHISQMQHPYTGAKGPASTAAPPLGVSILTSQLPDPLIHIFWCFHCRQSGGQ